jgi:hypothetical protein
MIGVWIPLRPRPSASTKSSTACATRCRNSVGATRWDRSPCSGRARGTARPDSDLDLLVDWSGPASLLDYSGLRAELEERIGLRVELTNRRLLKPALAPVILEEAVAV